MQPAPISPTSTILQYYGVELEKESPRPQQQPQQEIDDFNESNAEDSQWEDEFVDTADLINGIKRAESKEDILVLLGSALRRFNHEDERLHDQNIRDGTAKQFVISLHNFLQIKPFSSPLSSSSNNVQSPGSSSSSSSSSSTSSSLFPPSLAQTTSCSSSSSEVGGNLGRTSKINDERVWRSSSGEEGTKTTVASTSRSSSSSPGRSGGNYQYYRTSFGALGALQVTVLCAVVEMCLRCSNEVLTQNIGAIFTELVPCLPKLVDIFVAWDGDETVRQFNLSNATKIIHRIGAYVPSASEQLLCALLVLLKGHVSPDIKVDAAISIASLLDWQEISQRRLRCINMIDNESSLIISTLSTAALATVTTTVDYSSEELFHNDDDLAEEILHALNNLVINSLTICAKISRRRCAILAINKYLSHPKASLREIALSICRVILDKNNNDKKYSNYDNTNPVATNANIAKMTTKIHSSSTLPPIDSYHTNTNSTTVGLLIGNNAEILIHELIRVAKHDSESRIRMSAISLLGDAVSQEHLQPFSTSIMEALLDMAKNNSAPDVTSDTGDTSIASICGSEVTTTTVAQEAAVAYMKATTSSMASTHPDTLKEIAKFATLPYVRARTVAICTLEVLLTNPDTAYVLLNQTEMLHSFAHLIANGSKEDCTDVMQLTETLATNCHSYHQVLCRHTELIASIVDFIHKQQQIQERHQEGGVGVRVQNEEYKSPAGTIATVANRVAYMYAVDTILALMSIEDNMRFFVPHSDLLPCLVTLANTTTLHDTSPRKKQLISAIVGLSSAILE